MRKNLTPAAVNLDFLDGYLFAQIQSILRADGADASGLYTYYESRFNLRIGGLMEYEEQIARYLLSDFKGRPVVHPGTGIGTLPCVLASNGTKVLGIEANGPRVATAKRIRETVISVWPEAANLYNLTEGLYPDVVKSSPWISKDAILVFTNLGNDWGEALSAAIIDSMRDFGDVLLDLRLFCGVREEEGERDMLFNRIAATAREAKRLPHVMQRHFHLAWFKF